MGHRRVLLVEAMEFGRELLDAGEPRLLRAVMEVTVLSAGN
jgi:hypothetical protein